MDVVFCARDDNTEMGMETGYLLYYLLKNLAEGMYLTRVECDVIVRMTKNSLPGKCLPGGRRFAKFAFDQPSN